METELMMQNLTKGDPDAFQQFYDRYSLPVYHYIMDKTGDPERTRQMWRNTFRGLLSMLRYSDPPDLPLLLLTALADRQLDAASAAEPPDVAPDSADHQAADAAHDAVPDASVSEDDASSAPDEASTPVAVSPSGSAVRKSPRRAGLICLLLVLILLGIFALWTATGFLMALDVLPAYDLGYTWFNRVIFRLFPSSFP